MANAVTTAMLALAALVPAPAQKEAVKQPPASESVIIIRRLPHRITPADGNYVVEGDDAESGTPDAEKRYAALKKALDERFAAMFDLKAWLDKQQSAMAAKWDEYYALHEKYNRELQRIIASWVTESNYAD